MGISEIGGHELLRRRDELQQHLQIVHQLIDSFVSREFRVTRRNSAHDEEANNRARLKVLRECAVKPALAERMRKVDFGKLADQVLEDLESRSPDDLPQIFLAIREFEELLSAALEKQRAGETVDPGKFYAEFFEYSNLVENVNGVLLQMQPLTEDAKRWESQMVAEGRTSHLLYTQVTELGFQQPC
jgi:hypothetical protein